MKKKVLLVNPRFTEEVSVFSIPVSLFYLGSWLTQNGYEVTILDALHIKGELELERRLASEISGASCVGLTVMSTQIPHALEISKFIKRYNSSMPVIWGGIHPTLYPEQTVSCEYVDYVVFGEGEYSLVELVERNFDPHNILGVAYHTKGCYPIVNPPREPTGMDELLSLDWYLLEDLEPGLDFWEMAEKTDFGLSLITTRGCPHRCTFCINSILKTKYRKRNLPLVINDIREAANLGIKRIIFEDEDFFADKKRIGELTKGIEEENLKFDWAASVRTDYFSPNYLGNINFLRKVKDSGCWFLSTGAESGSQRILDMIEKRTKVEDTLNMAECLREAEIKGNFSFMIGLPGEEESDYKMTLEMIEKTVRVNPDTYILGPQTYRPYPGSILYNECLSQGMEEPKSVEEWAKSPYIHFEFGKKSHYNKELYPWVKYRGDLTNLIFYATLLGVRPRLKPVTYIIRLIGKIRCRLYFFDLPLLKWIYGMIRGSWIENLLRRWKVI